MKRILVAVDFSKVTARAMREAVKLARAGHGKLWLLHVAPPDPEFVGYEVGPTSVRQSVAHQLRREHRDLQAKARRLQKQGLKATALLVQGSTVSCILKECQKLKIQYLILGSHGHGALYRSLMGSVCEGVMRKAPCPVLIVPSRK